MLRFSGGLVLIQYNGLFHAAAGAVGAEVLPAFSAVPYRTRDKYPDWRFQYATLRDSRFGAGSSANLTADTLEHGSVSAKASNSHSKR